MTSIDHARVRRFKELVIGEDDIRAEFAAAKTKFHTNLKSNHAKQYLYIDPFTSSNDMIVKSPGLKKIVDAAGGNDVESPFKPSDIEPHLLEFEAQCDEQIIEEM